MIDVREGHSRDTLEEALPGGDVEGRVPVHVDGGERTPGVQHQLSDLHAARERRPVEAHIRLLTGDGWKEGERDTHTETMQSYILKLVSTFSAVLTHDSNRTAL